MPAGTRSVWIALFSACAACLAGCAQPRGAAPITDCEPVGRARPICGFQNPEDLALLPDGYTLVVSEYGDLDGGRPGDLAGFDTRSERRSVLFRGEDAAGMRPADAWGDPACPGPPSASFSPHGIHLDRRADGALQLLAVQHGGRESIEFFEVAAQPAGGWSVAWRGCLIPPPDSYLNDVVALPDGGLATTHMLPRSESSGVMRALELPAKGYVLLWSPAAGFTRLPNSEASIANGIERSRDGRILYLNSSGGSEVIALERPSGRVLRRIPVPLPDNSTWAPDGRLIVASLVAGFEGTQICTTVGGRSCPAEFQLLAIEPDTGAIEVLYRNAGAPMGAGTVGLRIGDVLYAGSFRGDRLLRVDLSAR